MTNRARVIHGAIVEGSAVKGKIGLSAQKTGSKAGKAKG
jgi:hypothetical protein